MLNKKPTNNQGFTLPEIMVTISIFIIISTITMDYLRSAFKIARFSNEQQTAVNTARDSMAIMTKEIRGANSSEQGDYPLITIDDDDLVFFSDVDDDDRFERIRYYADASTLFRVKTEPSLAGDYSGPSTTTTIANYLNNNAESVFSYYDEQYIETDVINRIRLIKINLKINVTPSIAPNDIYVESDINLRNLKDNL